MTACLAPADFARARAFVLERGRPLEQALFRRRFEGGAASDVVEALAPYQNADGGFGQALEPDYRARASSVLATCMAFRALRRGGVGAEADSMAARATAYLAQAYDAQRGRWPIVPGDADAEPHAPWWDSSRLEETFHGCRLNPTAECAAILLERGSPAARALGDRVAALAVERIESAARASGPDEVLSPSEVECAVELATCPGLPPPLAARLSAVLPAALMEATERDPAKWGEYCMKPYWACPGPASVGAVELRGDVLASLEYEIASQCADGGWNPHWNWGGCFPEAESVALFEWRGALALRILEALGDHGMLGSLAAASRHGEPHGDAAILRDSSV